MVRAKPLVRWSFTSSTSFFIQTTVCVRYRVSSPIWESDSSQHIPPEGVYKNRGVYKYSRVSMKYQASLLLPSTSHYFPSWRAREGANKVLNRDPLPLTQCHTLGISIYHVQLVEMSTTTFRYVKQLICPSRHPGWNHAISDST